MHSRARFAAVNPQLSLAALHDRMIVFAQDEGGGLVHVDAARRGKNCNCRCLACGEALIARHGDIKAHSFAHASGRECQFAADAMLNRLAQELIAAAGVFVTPDLSVRAARSDPYGMVRRDETITACRLRVESAVVDRRVHKQRPSVVLMVGGRELLLELTYAHRLDAAKRGAIEKLGLAAIEMHVADGMFSTVEQFERHLLGGVDHKHWIFNPKAAAIEARLDAAVAASVARQNAQHAREVEAARAAESLRQTAIKAAVDEKWRIQALRDSAIRNQNAQLATPVRADPQEVCEAHVPTMHYRLRDGGILLRHEAGGGLSLVPESGREAVLRAFAELGLQFDAERGAYLAGPDQIADVMLALSPFQLGVRSI
jgi:hypothetical protein